MAKKITELPSSSTLAAGDLLVCVTDLTGTATTKKITFQNLVNAVVASILSGGSGRTIEVVAVDPTTGDPVTLEFEGGLLKTP
jgi:hypothetical protein